MTRLAVALAFALTACGGGSGGDDGDDDVVIDAPPSSGTCTNAVFDPCTENAQCDSMNCHLFQQSAFQVCVQPCTPGDNTTCPVDASGVNGTCNNMGICKPAVPNACTR
ncbi:MAG: hypothetical protein ABI867_32910 [Kofleriaceae bacterium]